VTLPTGTSEQGRTTLSRLQNLHGAQFDRDFMNDQIKAHESVLKQFHQEMTSTQDMRLKAFTMLTAPTLREHLALARAVDNALKSSQS
jgi:putative membrane protein